MPRIRSKQSRGQALIEASLLVPMIFFLFLAMTNFGFFIYAFITTGNAARAAAQYTANPSFVGQQPIACRVVLREMATLENVFSLGSGQVSTGLWTSSNTCSAAPLTVTVAPPTYTEPTSGTPASRVTVTYNTIRLFLLPFMSGQMTISRTATMRLMPAS
ncbi:MAG TPA: TadE family protein [Bryobacterales bacterium]|nr:TadE family protein [Bryobacterales bacterium]